MKILIAYDGSSCADAALDDLRRAGLLLDAEAVVVSVAEVWLPPLPPSGHNLILSAFTEPIPAAVKETHAHAQTASQRIQKYFPAWKVQAEAYAGSPASVVLARAKAATAKLRAAGLTASFAIKEDDPKRALLDEAEKWKADCIFVGATGLGGLGRFLLGSRRARALLG
jgi:nucleotide-binding universal stress UspA family protein